MWGHPKRGPHGVFFSAIGIDEQSKNKAVRRAGGRTCLLLDLGQNGGGDLEARWAEGLTAGPPAGGCFG